MRDAADGLARLFAGLLEEAAGDAFVVAEAGELPARSALRHAFEDHRARRRSAATRTRRATAPPSFARSWRTHRVAASADALQYLVEHLGGDRLLTRSELEKLALYAGDGGRVDLDAARHSVGDSAALALDDAVMAAAEGDVARLERVLDRVFQEGEAPVAAARALLRHLHRLHGLAARVAAGSAISEAVRTARPPIFFKHQDSIKRQLARWSEPGLRAALDRIAQAELHMKTTGLPAETVCREAWEEGGEREGGGGEGEGGGGGRGGGGGGGGRGGGGGGGRRGGGGRGEGRGGGGGGVPDAGGGAARPRAGQPARQL